MSAVSKSYCNRHGLLVGRPPSGSGRWRNARIDLVDELALHKKWLVEK